MDSRLRSFEDALIVRNVVARTLTAMEHATPEALKKYLHEHPDADPKNHRVKQQGGGGSGDHGAEAESSKSKSRAAEVGKHYGDMKSLKGKVDSADPTAKKKFDGAYDKIYAGGESAAKAGQKLVKQLSSVKGEQQGAAVKMLQHALQAWEGNRSDHVRAKGEFASKKLQQADQTHAYAQKLEEAIQDVGKALKGDYD